MSSAVIAALWCTSAQAVQLTRPALHFPQRAFAGCTRTTAPQLCRSEASKIEAERQRLRAEKLALDADRAALQAEKAALQAERLKLQRPSTSLISPPPSASPVPPLAAPQIVLIEAPLQPALEELQTELIQYCGGHLAALSDAPPGVRSGEALAGMLSTAWQEAQAAQREEINRLRVRLSFAKELGRKLTQAEDEMNIGETWSLVKQETQFVDEEIEERDNERNTKFNNVVFRDVYNKVSTLYVSK